mgnify:CR=1 FL=1
MENNLYVSPSPHIHGGDSISKNMYGVLIALIPAFLVSLYFFGLGALIVTVVSVLACMIFEYLIQRFLMKKEPTLRWLRYPDGRIAGLQPTFTFRSGSLSSERWRRSASARCLSVD